MPNARLWSNKLLIVGLPDLLAELADILQNNAVASTKRKYVGASAIGVNCGRQLWYEFNERLPSKPSAKRDMIFSMGHITESLLKGKLIDAGFVIKDAFFDCSDFDMPFKGHVDGIITASPTGLQVPCLLEIKSMNTFVFKKLQKTGLKDSSPQYWRQMQIYMHYICRENPGLLMCMDKNNCEVYYEIIEYDESIIEFIKSRFDVLGDFEAPDPPDNLTWECDYCDYSEICEKKKERKKGEKK